MKSEISGDFENLAVAMLAPREEFLARALHKTVDGLGTDERGLDEILVSNTNAEIKAMAACYRKLFKSDMVEDIKKDTSGLFQEMLCKFAEVEMRIH